MTDYETKGREDAARNDFRIPHTYPETDEERRDNLQYEMGYETWLIERGLFSEDSK